MVRFLIEIGEISISLADMEKQTGRQRAREGGRMGKEKEEQRAVCVCMCVDKYGWKRERIGYGKGGKGEGGRGGREWRSSGRLEKDGDRP